MGADFAVEADAHYPAQTDAERSKDINFILCTEGAAVVEVNMRTYDIAPRTQIVSGFDSLLRVVGASPNFRCSRMCFSPNFIERMGARIDLRLLRFLRLNPVEQFSESDYDALVRHVYALATTLARRAHDPHRNEKIVRLLTLYLDDISDNSYKAGKTCPTRRPTGRRSFSGASSRWPARTHPGTTTWSSTPTGCRSRPATSARCAGRRGPRPRQ